MQLVLETQIGSTEESSAVDSALQRLAERDPSYYGPQASSLGAASRPISPGSIRDMCFMDLDVCFWQTAQQQMCQVGCYSSSGLPAIGSFRHSSN